MKAVPVLWLNAGRDRVVGVLRRDGFAKGDGDEEAGGCAFGVDCRVDGTGLYPFFAEGGNVLGLLDDVLVCWEGTYFVAPGSDVVA